MKHNLVRRNMLKNSLFTLLGIVFFKNLARANPAKTDAFSGSTLTDEPVNDTLRTIQNLYTTHGNFSDREVSDENLALIKEACIRAANSSNMQTYSIVVVKDRDLMQKVCGYRGSCMMLFNVDYNRLLSSAESLGLTYYPDNMTSFITAGINTSITAQTATIAARSLGIDTLLTNGIHRGNMERLWQLLGLPEKYCMPLIALVLGYADQQPDHKVGRLTGKGIFHDKSYQKLSNEEITGINSQYDDPSRHLGLYDDWKKEGHEHYLEWLFKVWLKRDSAPTESETQLFTQLQKRGFVELQPK